MFANHKQQRQANDVMLSTLARKTVSTLRCFDRAQHRYALRWLGMSPRVVPSSPKGVPRDVSRGSKPPRATQCDTVLLASSFSSLIVTLFVLLPLSALAAELQHPLCTFPGCQLPPSDILGGVAIPEVARIALNAAAALAVIFGIVGGARYLISRGKDEEVEKGKNTILWALGGMFLALASHRIVMAVLSQNYVGTGTDPLFEFFNMAIRIMMTLLNVTFLLMIFWGAGHMVMARGKDEDVTKGRKTIFYAILGAVAINIIPYMVRAVILINP